MQKAKYKEIFRLKEMLEKAQIPFYFHDIPEHHGHQIVYTGKSGFNIACSVIQHDFSYGGTADLLEISGLLTDAEKKRDAVLGWQTAEDVFNRIETHWTGLKDGDSKNE